jgi:hypothetical protein
VAIATLILVCCSHRFANLTTQEYGCGYRQVPFSEFASCIQAYVSSDQFKPSDNSRPGSPSGMTNDSMTEDFTTSVNSIITRRDADQISDKDAYIEYGALKQRILGREEAHNQSVKDVGAALAVGAAVGGAAYAISKGAGGGGGYSTPNSDARGCCSWHGGLNYCAADGRWVCMDGQYSPTCTCP